MKWGHWQLVTLDGSIPADDLLKMIDLAYDLTDSTQFAATSGWMALVQREEVTESTLHELIAHVGLTPKTDAIFKLLQPSLRLKTTPVEWIRLPWGASKMGGVPDLPKGWDYPRYQNYPLGFLAQINLSELPPDHPVTKQLPRHGMLYFFCSQGWSEYMPDGVKDDPNIARVLYYDGDMNEFMPVHITANQHYSWVYQEASITFIPQWTLPDRHDAYLASELVTGSDWSDAELEKLGDLSYDLRSLYDDWLGYSANHQLLGYPFNIQDTVIYTDIQLLLQVDTDHNNTRFQWGDGGMVYFTLPSADLLMHQFDNVESTMDCY